VKPADAIVALTQLARGERRYSLENRETEEVLNLSLALLMELSVAFDRIDRLERVVAERTGIPLTELQSIDYPEGAAAEERDEATNALMARVLRIRFDPRTRDDTAA
jgi:hypothetical protein